MTEEQKKRLETQLWNIANTLRGKMNADEFRDYILGFIFYKYLSEKMYIYANRILEEDGLNYLKIDENSDDGREYLEAVREEAIEQLGYFLKPSELFSEVAKRGNSKGDEGASTFILGDLQKILTNIERSTMGTESEDDFDKLFEDLDLTSTKLGRTETAKNDLIAKVLVHLDAIDFELNKVDSDVLGDAYEYLIGQFASGAGKKAGEFYTPREVSTVLARIVTTGKDRLQSVYDPTCGSGSLLLRVAREVKEVSHFYGQEMNRTTYNLARMNMILHDVHYSRFEIRQEDTLEHPQHEGMKFEAVVANPPFSANWSANPIHLSDDRFSQYGRLAPASKADFAFVQHMIHHLQDNGIMAVILPHGALFRGGAEGHIREYLIKDRNYLDAVIGLPPNIFYGTSIPTCILVFKKCRENGDDILFVDAGAGFEKSKNQNMLRCEDIDKIIFTYRERRQEPRYSYRATLKEVEDNEFNLNIPRYVDIFEDEADINIDYAVEILNLSNSIVDAADAEIIAFCNELGLKPPLGSNISALRYYKIGLLQALFGQHCRFRRENGDFFPKWRKQTFGETFDFVSTNSLSRDALSFSEGTVQNIHYGDIHTRYRSQFYQENEDIPYIKPDFLPSKLDNTQFCRVGDIVIADASEDYKDIGKSIEILNVKGNSLVAGLHTILARPKAHKVAVGYSGYLLQTFAMRRQIMRIAQGISVLGISKNKLAKLTIPLPHPDEQQKIAKALSAVDAKIQAIVDDIRKISVFNKNI